MWIYFLKKLSNLSQIYIGFVDMDQTEFSKTIKILHIDNTMEYKDSIILSFLNQQETFIQRSCLRTSKKNDRARCKHHHILDFVSVQLLSTSYPEKLRGEAAFTSTYVINHLPSSVCKTSPSLNVYSVLFLPTLTLKFFCCSYFILLHSHEHTKLKHRVHLCCFLGYETEHKVFCCWAPISK